MPGHQIQVDVKFLKFEDKDGKPVKRYQYTAIDDATRHDVIVARLMNNRPMRVREKGPLFIVYPFDTKAELRSELYYNRAAWQLTALHIR